MLNKKTLAWRGNYGRKHPLVLINGLAEQAESWYRNVDAWRSHFEVHTPALLAYDGPLIQQRIEAGDEINIAYFVERLRIYVSEFVQRPVHLLANSMGGKIAVEFAIAHPALVRKLVLLCPSGLATQERLPLVDGVRRSDLASMVESVFHDCRHADGALLDFYRGRFRDRAWRSGLLRTIRGTMDHSVRHRLPEISQPTLLVVGEQDRIVDPQESIDAAKGLRNGTIIRLTECGHAPQIERSKIVNRLVSSFLAEAS